MTGGTLHHARLTLLRLRGSLSVISGSAPATRIRNALSTWHRWMAARQARMMLHIEKQHIIAPANSCKGGRAKAHSGSAGPPACLSRQPILHVAHQQPHRIAVKLYACHGLVHDCVETWGIQLAAWQSLNMDSVKKNMITKSTVKIPPPSYPALCFLALLK